MVLESLTDGDIQSFVRRLEDFGNGLPPKEQTLLAELLVSAAAGQDDVEGHMFDPTHIHSAMSVLGPHMHAVGWHQVVHQLTHVVQHVHQVWQGPPIHHPQVS